MAEQDVLRVAENAKFIVCGYAFTGREDELISILNLDHPDCAMVVKPNGEMIESNMDPIEQKLVLELCGKNLQFMEA